MKTGHKLIAITFSICFLLIFKCVDISPTNQYDRDYTGDYKYSIEWNPITSKESRYIFQTYSLFFKETGNDKFESFKITHPDTGTADYIIDKNMLYLYFKKEYEGKIIFTGIRPNKIEIHDTCEILKITHPFEIKGDTLLGIEESILIKIECLDSNYSSTIQNSQRAVWTLYDTVSDTTDWNSSPSLHIDNKGQFELCGGILDSNNYIYWLDSITLHVPGYRPKINYAYIDEYNPYLGDTVRFFIKINHDHLNENSGNIGIVIKGKNNKLIKSRTVSLKDLNKPIYQQINDTGVVDFFVQTTLNGLTDSISVTAKIKYVIPQPVFSDSILEIPLGDTVHFFAVDKNRRPGTNYIWTIKNKGYTDTVQSTEFKYYFEKDTVDTIEIFGSFFDLRGKPDRMILDIKKMEYMLRIDTFPNEVNVVGDSIEFKVYVIDSTGSQIPENVEYMWEISERIYYNTDSNVCKIFIDEHTDSFYVSVYAIINKTEGIKTSSVRQKVYVKKFKPLLYFAKKEYINIVKNTVQCSVIVDDVHPRNIEQIYWKLGDTTVIDSSPVNESVWSGKFQNEGNYILYAWAKDNDGMISDTQRVIITIISEGPFIKNLTYENKLFYKKQSTFYLETEKLSNEGKIVKWFWDFDSDTAEWDTMTDTNLCSRTFSEISDTGQKIFRAKCRDKSSKYSPVFEKDFRINPGFPEISEINTDKSDIYIKDKRKYSVKKISDINGDLKKIFFIVDNNYIDSILQPLDTAEFHYTFSSIQDVGSHVVKIGVEDDDGFRSFVKESIDVRLGKPEVDNVSIIPEDSEIFLNDTITILVSAHDPNDTIKKVYITYGESNFPYDSLQNEKPQSIDLSFKHIYSINDTGRQTIKVRLIDNDGFLSEIKDTTISVKSGKPKLKGITTTDSIIWVVDNTTIYVNVSDTNGSIDSLWVVRGIDTSGGFGESIPFELANRKIFFTVQFSKSQVGWQYFWVKVRDDDSLYVAKKCSVFVNLGQPVIRGGVDYGYPIQWKADTMFYVYQTGNVVVAVDTFDTNGSVDSIWWDLNNNGWNGSTSEPIYTLNSLDLHEAKIMKVVGQDNDTIRSAPFVFYVYADSMPPAPMINQAIIPPKAIILWKNMDYKDSLDTEYKILLSQGNEVTENDILIEFKKGSDFKSGSSFGYEFQYIFDQGISNASYSYKVIARDARGSVSESIKGSLIYP